jgi:hypothetical protein
MLPYVEHLEKKRNIIIFKKKFLTNEQLWHMIHTNIQESIAASTWLMQDAELEEHKDIIFKNWNPGSCLN